MPMRFFVKLNQPSLAAPRAVGATLLKHLITGTLPLALSDRKGCVPIPQYMYAHKPGCGHKKYAPGKSGGRSSAPCVLPV